jgi:hypothetical protein
MFRRRLPATRCARPLCVRPIGWSPQKWPRRAQSGIEASQTMAVAKKPLAGKPRANFQQAPRGLEGSGMGTGWKILIAGGVAAALAGIMLSIDGQVEDNTPSTKGERTNEPF